MKLLKKTIILFCLVISSQVCVTAQNAGDAGNTTDSATHVSVQSATDLQNELMAQAIEKKRIAHKLSKDDFKLNLLIDNEYSDLIKKFEKENDLSESGYATEILYYVSKDELVKNNSTESRKLTKDDINLDLVSVTMRSVSKMEGMQYYSNSRKRYETLLNKSYRVKDVNSKEKLEDITTGSADGLSICVFQEEHTFGDTFYSFDYNQGKNSAMLRMQNLTGLSYGVFDLLKPNNLTSFINVIEKEDGYFIYVFMNAKFKRVSFLEKKMNKSFSARIDAIYNWVVNNL